MRDLQSPTKFSRRTAIGLLGAGLAAPFIRPGHAEAAWPEQTVRISNFWPNERVKHGQSISRAWQIFVNLGKSQVLVVFRAVKGE